MGWRTSKAGYYANDGHVDGRDDWQRRGHAGRGTRDDGLPFQLQGRSYELHKPRTPEQHERPPPPMPPPTRTTHTVGRQYKYTSQLVDRRFDGLKIPNTLDCQEWFEWCKRFLQDKSMSHEEAIKRWDEAEFCEDVWPTQPPPPPPTPPPKEAVVLPGRMRRFEVRGGSRSGESASSDSGAKIGSSSRKSSLKRTPSRGRSGQRTPVSEEGRDRSYCKFQQEAEVHHVPVMEEIPCPISSWLDHRPFPDIEIEQGTGGQFERGLSLLERGVPLNTVLRIPRWDTRRFDGKMVNAHDLLTMDGCSLENSYGCVLGNNNFAMPFNDMIKKAFLRKLVMFFINAGPRFGCEGGYRWEQIDDDDETSCLGLCEKILCPNHKVSHVHIGFKKGDKANSQDGVFAGMGHRCYVRGSNGWKTDEALAVFMTALHYEVDRDWMHPNKRPVVTVTTTTCGGRHYTRIPV